ncbi:hypothetical protein [Virgisporangium ochraceum]|uniref:DUF11 domain-containing protein n=1 Tax=Virgisporangium ochraceum TaxID=65505 RepID=A0A8J4A096_9ACTN|nr:hypothetical protein [Virgisporangium ochraceum]GIJ73367.1 hypothetical protein Voc01_082840 [Virgisporangium ochraceum]
MTDREDQLMTALFADLRREVAPHVRPAGAAAAAVTVRRRRRTRAVAGAALAVALLVGPAVGLAWARDRSDAVPDVGTPPSATATAASADPGTAPDLGDSVLQVPAWPAGIDSSCPSGQVRFSGGRAMRDGMFISMKLGGDPVPVDVDRDGRNEAVARIDCGIYTQVVVFSRTPDGAVTTVGRILATHVEGSDVQQIWRVEPVGPLTIRVDVGDVAGPEAQHQWRTYAWDGQRFVQSGGPTSFSGTPNTTDLALDAPSPMAMAATGGTWTGSLVVTLTNKGPNQATRLEVTLTFGVEVALGGPDADACGATATTRSTVYTCRFASLGPGASREFRWDVTASTSPRGKTTTVTANHGSATGESYQDLRPADNTVTVDSP